MSLRLYSLFGLTMATDFPFITRLGEGKGKPDIIFKIIKEKPLNTAWSRKKPIYSASIRFKSSDVPVYFYQLEECDIFRFMEYFDFYIFEDRIICHLKKNQLHLVEIHFLGNVLSYWLERRGFPTIHSSAINIDGNAIAFLSSNKGGKTSLAASLMKMGYSLITDDIMPIDQNNGQICCRPGYPTMRMWPDVAEHFIGHYEDLPIVHPELSKRRVFVGPDNFGTFHNIKTPLKCIYIPERIKSHDKNTEIKFKALSPTERVIELIKYSFNPFLVEAVGLQHKRMQIFSKIALKIPVKRIIYPSGYEHIEDVCNAIIEDVKKSNP